MIYQFSWYLPKPPFSYRKLFNFQDKDLSSEETRQKETDNSWIQGSCSSGLFKFKTFLRLFNAKTQKNLRPILWIKFLTMHAQRTGKNKQHESFVRSSSTKLRLIFQKYIEKSNSYSFFSNLMPFKTLGSNFTKFKTFLRP